MLTLTEKREGHVHPRPKERRPGHLVLKTKRGPPEKAGYQSPIDNEQYMTTKPRLNDSGDIVTLWRLQQHHGDHNDDTGDLHVASEYDDWALESKFPAQEKNKLSVWTTACSAVLQKKTCLSYCLTPPARIVFLLCWGDTPCQ